MFFTSLYQSRTNDQQSVTPQTQGLPHNSGLYPSGFNSAHCSVFGLTIYQGKLLCSQLIRSAWLGVGGVMGWLWKIPIISPKLSAFT